MEKKKSKKGKERLFDEAMFNAAGSSGDCTGLIPSSPETDSQYDSYRQLENFDAAKPHK